MPLVELSAIGFEIFGPLGQHNMESIMSHSFCSQKYEGVVILVTKGNSCGVTTHDSTIIPPYVILNPASSWMLWATLLLLLPKNLQRNKHEITKQYVGKREHLTSFSNKNIQTISSNERNNANSLLPYEYIHSHICIFWYFSYHAQHISEEVYFSPYRVVNQLQSEMLSGKLCLEGQTWNLNLQSMGKPASLWSTMAVRYFVYIYISHHGC